MSTSSLYHVVLCPFSRKVRFGMGEKGVWPTLCEEKVGEPSTALLVHHVEGHLPVLVEGGMVIEKSYPISEYLEEAHPKPVLMGNTKKERAEVRRLVDWFDVKLYQDVFLNLVYEKYFKRLAQQGGPDSYALKQGRTFVRDHLEYIGWLAHRRKWLGGDFFSWADVTAAAHLSCVDYVGEVPWKVSSEAKDWYMRVKSRPAFRPFLEESVSGLFSPSHYAALDF